MTRDIIQRRRLKSFVIKCAWKRNLHDVIQTGNSKATRGNVSLARG